MSGPESVALVALKGIFTAVAYDSVSDKLSEGCRYHTISGIFSARPSSPIHDSSRVPFLLSRYFTRVILAHDIVTGA